MVARGILVPGPGFEPASPALKGVFLTTGPPGRSPPGLFITWFSATKCSLPLVPAPSWSVALFLWPPSASQLFSRTPSLQDPSGAFGSHEAFLDYLSLLQLSYLWYIVTKFSVYVVKTFKIYFLSSFQVYSMVLVLFKLFICLHQDLSWGHSGCPTKISWQHMGSFSFFFFIFYFLVPACQLLDVACGI